MRFNPHLVRSYVMLANEVLRFALLVYMVVSLITNYSRR